MFNEEKCHLLVLSNKEAEISIHVVFCDYSEQKKELSIFAIDTLQRHAIFFSNSKVQCKSKEELPYKLL